MKTKSQLDELNSLLGVRELDLPPHRRTVGSNGSNFVWLSKNIGKRNKEINPRLAELLSMKFCEMEK